MSDTPLSLRCRRLYPTVVFGCLACFVITPRAFGQEPDDPAVSPDVGKYLMEGWLDARQRLKWAEFTITGEIETTEDEKKVVQEIWQSSSISPDVELHRTEWSYGRAAVWLEYPDKIVQWCYGSGKAAVVGIHKREDRNRQHALLIDPRLVPLTGTGAIPDWRRNFDSAGLGFVLTGTYSEVIDVGDGLYEFTRHQLPPPPPIDAQPSAWLSRIRISEKQGFSIQQAELFEIPPGQPDRRLLINRVNTQWREINGVWVPETVEATAFRRAWPTPGDIDKVVKLSIDWKSGNEPIDDSVFDVATFGAREGKSINDYRSDPDGMTISSIGNCTPDGSPLADPNALPPEVLTAPVDRVNPRLLWLLVANVLVFALLVYFVYRKRTSPLSTQQ